jgi:quinol monooxygenase YgiN
MKAWPIHEGAFTVLLAFECEPRESERFANELADFAAARIRVHPGFLSSLVYLSEDALKVFEIFQWARAEDWEAYRTSEDGRQGVEQLAGRIPRIEFLELVRAIGAAPPGNDVQRGEPDEGFD